MMATTEQQQAVDKWNSTYQIGQAVLLLKDSGETVRTKTRSAAEVLSGHTAVIWLEGVRGCYMLSRVKAAE
jgi:hypothetical protein